MSSSMEIIGQCQSRRQGMLAGDPDCTTGHFSWKTKEIKSNGIAKRNGNGEKTSGWEGKRIERIFGPLNQITVTRVSSRRKMFAMKK